VFTSATEEINMKKVILVVLVLLYVGSLALAQTVSELTPGAPISAELQPNEKHAYQIKLAADQTANIVVMQQGVDAQVNVYDPAGKLLIEMDSPNAAQGPEPVWLVNQLAGTYRIEVTPFTGEGQPPRGGKYEITLKALRAATPADAKVAQAQMAYLEGTRLSQSRDDGSRKAAAAKLEEAMKLLGNDSDPALTNTVRMRISFVAPFLKLQQMKLTKVPGTVTLYHSADNEKAAMEKRALLESLLNFYQPLLKTKLELDFAVLNKTDWAEISGGAPPMMPMTAFDPASLITSSDTQAVADMLEMFKSKVPAALNSALAAEGLSYETSAPLVSEAGSHLMMGLMLLDRGFGRLPEGWMALPLGSYLIHAWLGEKQPQLHKRMRLAMQIPGAVMSPNSRTLQGVFRANDMFAAGYAFSRAADLGAQLYDTHKLGLLAEIQKAFPKGEKLDAAAAEARFGTLSPHIKPWMESFNYTGTALEVKQAEEALVAARKAKDAAAFDRLVASDYAGLNQMGQQRNLAGFRASATNPNPVAVFTLDRVDIEITGDIAIVRGAQTEQWQGGPLEHHLFTRIWVKRDGRWQLQSNTQFIDPNRR
jgi:ketosteroid isomerase-like protein